MKKIMYGIQIKYNIKLPHVVIVCLMQFLFLLSFSQTTNLKFSHLTTRDGLSQSSVFAILKDYKGFMWFGTDEGLNKYDGYKFTVYKHDPGNPATIRDNSIYGLMEDAAHNLWVTSSTGLDRFDRLKESFIHFNSGDAGLIFKNIFQDSKKRIWLSTTNGFCLFDANKGKFQFHKNNGDDSESSQYNYVYKITEDDYGELWIATRGGLIRFNPETEKLVKYHNDPANSKSIGSGYIKTVFKDSRGNIWIGTEGSGIALFNRGDNSFINFKHDVQNKNSICHNDILSFTEGPDGKLWIGTENGGISVFDYLKNNFVGYQYNENDPFSISGNSVYSLYKDNIGNIWVGTWSGGINLNPFFGDKFSLYRKIPNDSNSLSNNLVLSISNGPDKNIWIGTDGGGLNRFDPYTHNFTNYHSDKNKKGSIFNDYVLSISEYLQGSLALGFHRGGLDVFNVQKQLVTHYPLKNLNSNKLTSPSINIVYKDKQQNLWLGNSDNGGIYLCDKKMETFTNFYADSREGKGVYDRSVFVMYETRAGQLWLGGDHGLDVLDRTTKKIIHYQYDPKNKYGLSNNSVYSIMEDHEGNMWLGTAGGLNFFDSKAKKFLVFTEKDGLPNNTIWSTQEDHFGNLWISTNNGLSRLNPSTKNFRNYTVSDGLQNNAFKAKASYQSPDGEMFFGGVNGFNTFYPDRIKDNDFVPPVYITDFQVFNKPVGIGGKSPLIQSANETKEITLSYYQSVFTLEFAALNFIHPEQNRYAYKLEGFDNEWNQAGNKRTATYTNLDPGTYTFKVKGSNNDGVWNETGASVKIIITPPFWLTWWFITFLALIVLSAFIIFYRIRVKIIRKWGHQLEVEVVERTQQLAYSIKQEKAARQEAENARSETDSANKDLERKNKEVEQFAYIASHDLQEPLRTTSSFIGLLQKQYKGQLDEKADKYFNFILDASERMKVLIKNLLDYSRLGSKNDLEQVDCNITMANILADLHIAIEEAKAVISYGSLPVINGYPIEIKQLFQNLLINAIKFRKKDTPPRITISAQKLKNEWEFIFKDNGIGIAEKNRGKIFDMFQRLHSRTEYEGSGIGLSYCKKIVELHNGKIWVESMPGSGSAFYFTIREKIKSNSYEKIMDNIPA